MRKIASLAIMIVVYAAAQTPSPQFEVASIKPSPPAPGGRLRRAPQGGPGTKDPGLFHCENCSLFSLVSAAFDLNYAYQLSGLDLMESRFFEVAATIPPGTTKEQFHLMLQNLLAERFKMTFHRGEKQMQVYQLVIAKNGPKFKPSVEPPAPGADGVSARPKAKPSVSNSQNGTALHFPEGTIRQLLSFVSNEVDLPVIDATGLNGKYDITLSWSPGNNPDSPGPTIFGALQNQLGLKLEPKKAMVDIVEIDHIEKTPTEN